ncbi:MAG: hypothetical protein ACREA0_15740 [bacterium]
MQVCSAGKSWSQISSSRVIPTVTCASSRVGSSWTPRATVGDHPYLAQTRVVEVEELTQRVQALEQALSGQR